MTLKTTRAFTAAAAALALAGGLVALTEQSASADQMIQLNTAHSAGIYSQPDSRSTKTTPEDTTPGMEIMIACWTTGQTINNLGDVWYKITEANYDIIGWSSVHGWVYGAYVDNNAAFHSGTLSHC